MRPMGIPLRSVQRILVSFGYLAGSFVCAQSTKPVVLWPEPGPITFPTPLSPVQLDARVLASAPVSVSLSGLYNVTGITSDGVPYATGGFDGSSWAFSSELLGSAITWKGIRFPLGPSDQPDAVYGATIPLQPGSFSSLLMLADLVNNAQPPTAQFVINYTDGTSSTIAQSLSDWVNPRNYPGESNAQCYPTRHNSDGSIDLNSVCIYGYSLPLDPSRTPASLTLPSNRNVVVLSLVQLPTDVPGTLTYTPSVGAILTPGTQTLNAAFTPSDPAAFASVSASNSLSVTLPSPSIAPTITWPVPNPIPVGTALSSVQLDASASAFVGVVSVPLDPYFRVNAFYADGTQYKERGFDGSGVTFSASQLGPIIHYAGAAFPLGPAAIPDAVTSSTISLPSGNFSKLDLIGAAANGSQLSQPFTINYTDGTSGTSQLSLSSWLSPQHFAGETSVASTTLGNLPDGSQLAGNYSIYGYQLPVDSTRAVASLTLPSNPNVLILAAGLSTGSSFPISGSFTYTPPAGFVPPASTTLTTLFTPADDVDFTTATASVPLVVGTYDFTLQQVSGSMLPAITGEARSMTFTVAPTQDRYAGPISFSVQGFLPPLAVISFSPSSIPADGGAQTVTLTIQTRRLTSNAAPHTQFGPRNKASLALFCAVLFLPFAAWRRGRKRLVLLTVMLACLLPVGCGSGYADHVYTLAITATDGYTTHTLPFTLHVEASPQ